jgi:hypothetical protein
VNQRNIALHKPSKDRRSLEHIDITIGAGHAIKRVQNP